MCFININHNQHRHNSIVILLKKYNSVPDVLWFEKSNFDVTANRKAIKQNLIIP